MNNDTDTVIITIPVGDAVVKNLSDDIEVQWLRILINAMKHINLPKDHSNIIILIVMLCLFVMMTLRFVIKYRHRVLCQRKNEAQHKPTDLQVRSESK